MRAHTIGWSGLSLAAAVALAAVIFVAVEIEKWVKRRAA